ncbi:MAG: type II toxin-antitoxin system YafQ family toxin [Synergistaceae bacterium]|nr:type II toxin-antitoxin system YafQ family toxin [Synergistaceae bacterium]
MRKLKYRTLYKHDFKREYKGIYRILLKEGGELDYIVKALANDIPLPPKYKDHSLRHNWEGSRECHIKPDFLLVYTLEGEDLLILERLGTHSEIFGL